VVKAAPPPGRAYQARDLASEKPFKIEDPKEFPIARGNLIFATGK